MSLSTKMPYIYIYLVAFQCKVHHGGESRTSGTSDHASHAPIHFEIVCEHNMLRSPPFSNSGKHRFRMFRFRCIWYLHTVDGWNPAPPGMYETLWIMGKTTYQLVQDFSHQQYESGKKSLFGEAPPQRRICISSLSKCFISGLWTQAPSESWFLEFHVSGQIITCNLTRVFTPKWWFSKGNLLFQANLDWWNIIIWPDVYLSQYQTSCSVLLLVWTKICWYMLIYSFFMGILIVWHA